MNFTPLTDAWPDDRDVLQRVAAHVLANAQKQQTGHFALMPHIGGFATPQFGEHRTRIRVTGGSLFVERASGERDGQATATTDVASIAGSSIRELCELAGVAPDAALWVGEDTPELGDPDAPLHLDAAAADVLGDWYALGQRAMDAAVAALPNARASVARLWPEHFDVGLDVAVDPVRKPGVRCNLGAAAGDSFHPEPYLYVGPWDADRPGPEEYWNAPFGAVLGFAELDAARDPYRAADEFFSLGISYLRS